MILPDKETPKEEVKLHPKDEIQPEKAIDSDDVAIAAAHYDRMCRSVKGYSSVMNGKGLARVMVALAQFPYGDNYPKFRSKAEETLFNIMLSVHSAKAKIAEALKEELADAQDLAVDGIVKEELEKKNQTKENENGNE